MITIKSNESDTTITVDYNDFTNTVEIQVGNESGFRFVNLCFEKTDLLIEQLMLTKNELV
jgi:hypothetical protein